MTKSPPPCEFCHTREGSLLCDGKLPDGKSCDKRVCRCCAGEPVARVQMRVKGVRRCDTRDVCPSCREAGRKAW